jgi:hypothetical protein
VQEPVVAVIDAVQGKGSSRRRDRNAECKHDQRCRKRTRPFEASEFSGYESARHLAMALLLHLKQSRVRHPLLPYECCDSKREMNNFVKQSV